MSLDPAGRLTSTESKKATTVLQRFAYEHKLGANQQALVSKETDKDGVATTYGYDVANRLTSVAGGSSFAYAYDNAGNLTTKTAGASTTTYRHNQANQICWRLTGTSSNGCASPPAGATTYTYDAAGNETSASGTRSSVFNVREQLSSLTPAGASAVAMSYAGPGQALRTKKGSTTILNNQFGIGSHTTAGTPDYYTHDENGAVITQRRPSASSANKRTYLLTDRLGSTRTLTDANGTVVRRYAYEPYGADKSPTGT